MITDEMVERAAIMLCEVMRADAECKDEYGDPIFDEWDDCHDGTKREWRKQARAVLTAALTTPPAVGEPVAWAAWLALQGSSFAYSEHDKALAVSRVFPEDHAALLAFKNGPAPVATACPDRGMCELHERERRELLTQETVMGQRIMELERELATATADAGRDSEALKCADVLADYVESLFYAAPEAQVAHYKRVSDAMYEYMAARAGAQGDA